MNIVTAQRHEKIFEDFLKACAAMRKHRESKKIYIKPLSKEMGINLQIIRDWEIGMKPIDTKDKRFILYLNKIKYPIRSRPKLREALDAYHTLKTSDKRRSCINFY
jgi:hypothetical protein